jgi:ABC-type multidrug transport system fused ATPase/permease subunit
LFQTIKHLNAILDRRSRIHFGLLLIPMIIVTAMEVVSIGLILPVIQVLLLGKADGQMTTIISNLLPSGGGTELALLVTSVFAAVLILKNLLLLVMIFVINRVVAYKIADYRKSLFRVYLAKPLPFHFKNNSALLLRNVISGVGQSMGAIRITLLLGLDLLLMLGAFVLLVIVEPGVTIGTLIVLGLVSLIFLKIGNPFFRRWGEEAMILEGRLIKWVSQSFEGIRDVRLFNANNYLANLVGDVTMSAAKYESRMTTSVQVPRLLIETIIVIGFLGVVLGLLSTAQAPEEIIGTLGIFGMAALRLMPSLNRILMAATQIRQRSAYIAAIHEDFVVGDENPIDPLSVNAGGRLDFDKEIVLDNIVYAYPESDQIALRGIDLVIRKGQSVGFVGASGAGKSTLVDLILGFFTPDSGRFLIDGENALDNVPAWQRKIGFVPQLVFLMDDTLRRNVAFGIEDDEIDDDRVREVVRLVSLEDFVSTLTNGLNTIIGEHGQRLSGGQRQRVTIARALYRNPEVLVFDEATSALDGETERDISSAIDFISDDKTMLIVAHRLSTIRQCDMIVFMKDGKIVNTGTFEELRKIDPEFANLAKLGGQGDFLE